MSLEAEAAALHVYSNEITTNLKRLERDLSTEQTQQASRKEHKAMIEDKIRKLLSEKQGIIDEIEASAAKIDGLADKLQKCRSMYTNVLDSTQQLLNTLQDSSETNTSHASRHGTNDTAVTQPQKRKRGGSAEKSFVDCTSLNTTSPNGFRSSRGRDLSRRCSRGRDCCLIRSRDRNSRDRNSDGFRSRSSQVRDCQGRGGRHRDRYFGTEGRSRSRKGDGFRSGRSRDVGYANRSGHKLEEPVINFKKQAADAYQGQMDKMMKAGIDAPALDAAPPAAPIVLTIRPIDVQIDTEKAVATPPDSSTDEDSD